MNFRQIPNLPLFLLFFPTVISADSHIRAWTELEYKAAVHGCRLSILHHAARDVIEKRNLDVNNLPEGFDEKIKTLMAPVLELCDCSMEILSKEYDPEYFASQPEEIQKRRDSIVESGECTIDYEKAGINVEQVKNMSSKPYVEADCDQELGSCKVTKFKREKPKNTLTKE